MIDIAELRVGSRITFEGERMAYTVRAFDLRYIIATKPFAARDSYMYTIVDRIFNIRGPDNMIFGRTGGYDDVFEARAALRELNDPECVLDISHRHRVPLRIVRVRGPK